VQIRGRRSTIVFSTSLFSENLRRLGNPTVNRYITVVFFPAIPLILFTPLTIIIINNFDTADMFSKSILVSAFAALAYAQSSVLSFTRVPNPVTAGEATAITYATNDTTTPVTIILRKGPSGNLQTVSTLTGSCSSSM
jgi:hypothetical protein